MKRKREELESSNSLITTLPTDLIFSFTIHFLSLIDFCNFSLTCKTFFTLLRNFDSKVIKIEILIEIARFCSNDFIKKYYLHNKGFLDMYFNKDNNDLKPIFIIDDGAGKKFFSYFYEEERKLPIIEYINKLIKNDLIIIQKDKLKLIRWNLYHNAIINEIKWTNILLFPRVIENVPDYVNLFE